MSTALTGDLGSILSTHTEQFATETPALGDLMPSSGFCEHWHSHTHTHTHDLKYVCPSFITFYYNSRPCMSGSQAQQVSAE